MALLSWLAGALAGCGDEDVPPAPADDGPPLTFAEPQRMGPGGTLSSALSPDGALVAAGSTWGLALYERGALEPRWFEAGKSIHSVTFSGDGQRLAALDSSGVVTVRDLTGGVIATRSAEDKLAAIALSPDGGWLALGGADGQVLKAPVSSDAPPATLGGLSAPVRALAWSPDGRTLAACAEDGHLARWRGDETTASLQQPHSRHCRDLAWSPDGRHVASVGKELIVSTESGVVAEWPPSKGSRMDAVAWSPDGATLLTGMDQGWAQAWDAVTGEARGTLERLYSAPTHVQLGPDGLALVQADDATLWDLRSGQRLGVLPSPDSAVAMSLSPDGQRLALASRSSLSVLDLDPARVIAAMTGHSHVIQGLAFTADGGRVVSWSSREVLVWDASSGAELHRLEAPEGKPIEAAAFNPTTGRVVAASVRRPTPLRKELRLSTWDVTTGESLPPLRVDEQQVLVAKQLAWSGDGQLLLVAADSSAHVLDAQGELVATLEGLRGATGSTWAADDAHVVVTSADGPAQVRAARGGAVQARLADSEGPMNLRLVTSPDGQWILGIQQSTKGEVRLWRADGALVASGLFASGQLGAVAFHPTRPFVVGGVTSPDGQHSLEVWDLRSGQRTQRIPAPLGQPRALVWTTDGQALLANMDGGVVRLPVR